MGSLCSKKKQEDFISYYDASTLQKPHYVTGLQTSRSRPVLNMGPGLCLYETNLGNQTYGIADENSEEYSSE